MNRIRTYPLITHTFNISWRLPRETYYIQSIKWFHNTKHKANQEFCGAARHLTFPLRSNRLPVHRQPVFLLRIHSDLAHSFFYVCLGG